MGNYAIDLGEWTLIDVIRGSEYEGVQPRRGQTEAGDLPRDRLEGIVGCEVCLQSATHQCPRVRFSLSPFPTTTAQPRKKNK